MKIKKNGIGEKIKTLRKIHKETQVDLAKAVGLKKSSISMYEKETRIPNTRTLAKIAEHYKVNTDYLLGVKVMFTSEKEEIINIQNETGLSENNIKLLKKHKNNSKFQQKLEDFILFLDFIEGDKIK